MSDPSQKPFPVLKPPLKDYSGLWQSQDAPYKWRPPTRALRFKRRRLLYPHANLRISLRSVRARQRDSRPVLRLEGNQMSAVRLTEDFQEIFHLRLGWRGRSTFRQTQRVGRRRSLLRRRLPRALNSWPGSGLNLFCAGATGAGRPFLGGCKSTICVCSTASGWYLFISKET